MKRLLGLLIKDFKVTYRNYFLLVVVIVAGLLIVTTNYLIPEKMDLDSKLLYAVEEQDSLKLQTVIEYLESRHTNRKVNNRDEITQGMKKDKNTIGLLLKVTGGKPVFEIILQGYENERSKNALALALESVLPVHPADGNDVEIMVLRDAGGYKEIPFNKSFVPLLILNEPIMLGFIFLATLIFMEKEEDTIKAYIVSPGGLAVYLWSKMIWMIVLGLLSTVLITAFTIGIEANWLMLFIITISGSLFSSTVAILVASFFDTISKAMVWILGISIVLSAPMIAYFVPSFAPRFVTWIPTYHLMFSLREAIFPSGNTGIIYQSVATLISLSAVLFVVSLVSYKRSLLHN